MASCVDNDRLNSQGCGATFSGELQHSTAKVDWSEWEDGRAHITASLSVIDKCWAKGTDGHMADPATLGFEEDSTGRWRMPMSDEDRERLAALREGDDGLD